MFRMEITPYCTGNYVKEIELRFAASYLKGKSYWVVKLWVNSVISGGKQFCGSKCLREVSSLLLSYAVTSFVNTSIVFQEGQASF